MNVMTGDPNVISVECRNVWKIFGKNTGATLKSIDDKGVDKRRVLQDFGCVIGVSDASMQITKGETFCIMGLSGSGKSTLLRLINRLIEPSRGQVFIHGIDIGSMTAAELRSLRAKTIGMVFQNVALLPYRNVIDNVAFGLEIQKVAKSQRLEIARDALSKVGLADWTERFPDELSGGMQQRVGLARALAADPEILLMDEPFSALDPLIRRQLQSEFKELSRKLGKTTVFITHDLEEAIRIGDRIAIMKDGVIIQVGTPEEIVLKPTDDYVLKFVEGISRLHLVKAAAAMIPLELYQSVRPEIDVAGLARASSDTELNDLIAQSISDDVGRIAIEQSGHVVGIVTRKSLLQCVSGFAVDALAPD